MVLFVVIFIPANLVILFVILTGPIYMKKYMITYGSFGRGKERITYGNFGQ
jgi:hypothetical protein